MLNRDSKDKMKNITQKDIAEKLNVSRATVSLTLNKRASLYRISPVTQKKILNVSRQLGYSRNLFASYLRRRRSNFIGIIGSVYKMPMRQNRQNLIGQYLKSRGFHILMQDFHWAEDRIRMIKEIEELRPEGLIISEPEPDTVIEYLRTLKKKGLPVVLVDGPKVNDFDQVRIDREKTTYLGTKHLFEQGYKNVYLTLPKTSSYWAITERYKGFKKSLMEFGGNGNIKKFLIWNKKQYDCYYSLGYQLGEEFIYKEKKLPAGIMALNDQIAIGLMKFFLEKDFKIPQELGLVGSENLPESLFTFIPLSTIKFPIEQVAEKACKLLLDKIEGKTKENLIFTIEPELVVRQSSLKHREVCHEKS